MKKDIKQAYKLSHLISKHGIDEELFYHMLSAKALRWSISYQLEEREALDTLLRENYPFEQMNLAVVGCGSLWYVDLAIKYTNGYIGIDPLLSRCLHLPIEQLVQKHSYLTLLEKSFNTVQRQEFPSGNVVFVFMFNVATYIENLLTYLNRLLRPGDILFLSTWGQTKQAKIYQAEYYSYLNIDKKQEVFSTNAWQGKPHSFPWNELTCYCDHRYIQGEITDITVVYT